MADEDKSLLDNTTKKARKEQEKQAKRTAKKNGAKNVCRFGIVQGILSWLVLVAFVVSWFCLHKADPMPTWYQIVVMGILQIWVRAEKYICLVVWLICRHLKKKYESKGETLSPAKPAIIINRAYTFAGAVPTLVVQLVVWIMSIVK
ncbi:MAG: hypothetical protein J5636_08420 [Clostridiales bacterium]|nr:hypothetical protein [Clostridiales bacterium]